MTPIDFDHEGAPVVKADCPDGCDIDPETDDWSDTHYCGICGLNHDFPGQHAETIEQVSVTVSVRLNPGAAAGDAQDLARGIVEQALELGRDDMNRQADADDDPDDRVGSIVSWTVPAWPEKGQR